MSMVVNTNVSSLTAQRSLASSSRMLDTAMERLSTGSKINSASDDAAGLAIVQRMTAQIQGLQMAVKNANDGIAMTQSIEGALVEVSDMLQRLRELAIQAANATNTDSDRSFIQEEVNLLIAEISRISANTRYNGQKVLDGSFTNVQLQVGTEGGETINFSVDSTAANQLGSFNITGIGSKLSLVTVQALSQVSSTPLMTSSLMGLASLKRLMLLLTTRRKRSQVKSMQYLARLKLPRGRRLMPTFTATTPLTKLTV